jgi:hypothetical protein
MEIPKYSLVTRRNGTRRPQPSPQVHLPAPFRSAWRPPRRGSIWVPAARGRRRPDVIDRDTLEEDLDRVLAGPEPRQPVGEWDWEPPLGSAVPVSPTPWAEPFEREASDEADEPEEESDEEQGSEDDD